MQPPIIKPRSGPEIVMATPDDIGVITNWIEKPPEGLLNINKPARGLEVEIASGNAYVGVRSGTPFVYIYATGDPADQYFLQISMDRQNRRLADIYKLIFRHFFEREHAASIRLLVDRQDGELIKLFQLFAFERVFPPADTPSFLERPTALLEEEFTLVVTREHCLNSDAYRNLPNL